MPNPGFPEVRAAIADKLRREVALPFTAEHVCMTTGAAAACNVILKTILDPGDEVILLAPFFAEYPFYVGNHGGRVVVSRPTRNACRMSSASPRPLPAHSRHHSEHAQQSFGRVYPATLLRDLGTMLARLPNPPLVISDEPYKSLVYEGAPVAEVASLIAHTAICFPGRNRRPWPASASDFSRCRRVCLTGRRWRRPAPSPTARSGS